MHLKVSLASAVFALALPGGLLQAAEAPEAVVQTQLEAYNARNMDAFLATYAEDAELFGFPATLQTRGHAEMRKRYTVRFSDAILHCVIAKRIVMGNTVIDHERVQVTLPEGPGVMEAIAIYEVRDGKIAKVTFISGPRTVGGKLQPTGPTSAASR